MTTTTNEKIETLAAKIRKHVETLETRAYYVDSLFQDGAINARESALLMARLGLAR